MPAASKLPALYALAGVAWAALALPVSAQSTDPTLLPLLLQEQTMLEDFGADHPQVRAIRERIAVVRGFLARQAPTPAARTIFTPPSPKPAPTPPAPVIIQAVHTQPIVPRATERPSSVPVPDSVKGKNRERERERNNIPDSREAAGGLAANAKPPAELLPWVGLLAAFLVGLLFHVAALAFILRLCGSRWAPPLRIQLVGNAASLGSSIAESSDKAAPSDATSPSPKPALTGEPPSPPGPPSLDLGPTYADQLRQKEETRKEQEEAIFRHIFEQNVRLHAQLAKV